MSGLPGAELVMQGARSLSAGETTAAALLVGIAHERLSKLGILDPQSIRPATPELRLYELLCVSTDDAHYRYKALIGDLDAFLRCAEQHARLGAAPGDSA